MPNITYNIYRDGTRIAYDVTSKTYTDTDLDPNTEYSYQVSAENDFGESPKSSEVKVTTEKPPVVNVESVALSPKTSNAETGAADGANLTSTVTPENATDKKISYDISPEAEGLKVTNEGRITWSEDTPAGTYTTTVKTSDGSKTDTHVLTLADPESEITTKEEVEEIDVVEYETVRNETEELPKGEEEVAQKGVDGYTKVTYKITYEDGVEVDKEEIDREVIDPVDEIINVGTFEEPVITTETETENIDTVAYETTRNETEELPLGEEETVQEGVDGYTKVTYEVTFEDGEETERTETDREVIDPIDEIINVGTFEEPEPEPEPEE